MFILGFLIDKIHLFPFLIGFFLAITISHNESTQEIYNLFRDIMAYIKTSLEKWVSLVRIEKNNKQSLDTEIIQNLEDVHDKEL